MSNLKPVVVQKNVVNVHLEPATDTELVTQAIMGQPAWVIETREAWQLVQFADSYRGWLQGRFVRELVKNEEYPAKAPFGEVTALIADVHTSPDKSSGLITKLVLSTHVQVDEEKGKWTRLLLPSGVQGWVKTSKLEVTTERPVMSETPSAEGLVRQGKRLIGTPYLWGGTTPFGIDCSGFMQLCYHLNGYQLLRDAGIQCRDPRAIRIEPDDLAPGDLVFFSSPKDPTSQRITHVGMYIGDGEFMHSAGQSVGVTTSPLFSGYYWDVFSCARRMPGVRPA